MTVLEKFFCAMRFYALPLGVAVPLKLASYRPAHYVSPPPPPPDIPTSQGFYEGDVF